MTPFWPIKRFSKKGFVRNVAIVATGTAGAQAISIAFAPIIARLYGPEAFGILGTYVSIIGVVAPLAAFSYPIAMVLPKLDTDAVGLVKLSLKLSLMSAALIACILLFFGDWIISALGLESVRFFIWLLPPSMLFSVAAAVTAQWVIRKKLFKLKARVAVFQAALINSAKAGIGFFTPVAEALILLATFGGLLHAVMLYLGIRKSEATAGSAESTTDAVKLASCKELAWRHRDFAYYRTPQVFLNSASQSMPVLMLAAFFGPASAGFYSLCKVVLAAPTGLIGQSVASVFYPRFNEAALAGENCHRLLLQTTLALVAVGCLPFGLLIVFGPWVFSVVFGAEWLTAGVYVQWLAVWSFFSFINRPSVGAIPVLALQGYFLIYEILCVVLRAGALTLGFFVYNNAVIAVALFSLVGVLLNSVLILKTLMAAKRHDKYKSS